MGRSVGCGGDLPQLRLWSSTGLTQGGEGHTDTHRGTDLTGDRRRDFHKLSVTCSVFHLKRFWHRFCSLSRSSSSGSGSRIPVAFWGVRN